MRSVRCPRMRKKFRIRSLLSRGILIGAAAGVGALASANGRTEPEPQPDPAEVRLFLDRLEAQHVQEAERKKGHEKRLLNLVEDAATRTLSDSTINRVEKSVAARLG